MKYVSHNDVEINRHQHHDDSHVQIAYLLSEICKQDEWETSANPITEPRISSTVFTHPSFSWKWRRTHSWPRRFLLQLSTRCLYESHAKKRITRYIVTRVDAILSWNDASSLSTCVLPTLASMSLQEPLKFLQPLWGLPTSTPPASVCSGQDCLHSIKEI